MTMLSLLCTLVLCSCGISADDTTPSVNITDVNAGDTFISFGLDSRNSELLAYLITETGTQEPSAEEIFSEGETCGPGYYGCACSLKPETEYTIYAASRSGKTYSFTASASAMTVKARHINIDISYVGYAAIALRNVTPDDPDKKYVLKSFKKDINAVLEEYGLESPEEIPQYLYDNGLIEETDITRGKIIDKDIYDYNLYFPMNPESDLTVVCWYVNDDFSPASEAEVTSLRTTPVPDRSTMEVWTTKFEVSKEYIRLLLYSNDNYYNGDTPLFPLYFETWSNIHFCKASMFEEGMSDTEIAQTVLDYYADRGTVLGTPCWVTGMGNEIYLPFDAQDTRSLFIPEFTMGEDYLLVFFGTCAGKITTEPFIKRFTLE